MANHTAKRSHIQVKHIDDPPSSEDGVRILVDRLWPRGLTKEKAAVDAWMKEIAPSPGLRTWFGHRPERFAEFNERYERELKEDPVRKELANRICQMAAEKNVTLLYAAKDPVHNHAIILQRWLNCRGEP